jgi:predicted alpha/beta hydrolase
VNARAAAPLVAVSFSARDGRALSGLLTLSEAPRAALVVNGATGFKREFYLKFAAYCAQRGLHALVYDYRGMGASALQPLTTEPARMSDWGRLDMPAALGWLGERFPGLPLFTLGHSVGGQLIGCMPNEARARAHVMLAVSTGYWRRQRIPFRYAALLLWKVYGPLLLRRYGYLPRGRWLWTGESLPRGGFLQWREWCLSAAPLGAELDPQLRDSHFGSVATPLLSVSFSDDPIATPAAVEALLSVYSQAPVERRRIHPAQAGGPIGHHGFFFERHRATLWPAVLDWLEAHCS